jgi:hypothetical protein
MPIRESAGIGHLDLGIGHSDRGIGHLDLGIGHLDLGIGHFPPGCGACGVRREPAPSAMTLSLVFDSSAHLASETLPNRYGRPNPPDRDRADFSRVR